MRLDGFVTRAWLVALTLAACAARPCFAQDLPNIVLILPDDHGWEDLGFMGHPVIRTPHIDKLTSESLLFTRGYVPPRCAGPAWRRSSPVSTPTSFTTPWRTSNTALSCVRMDGS